MGTCTLIPANDVAELEVQPVTPLCRIWLDAFVVQRKLIEQGIRDGLPLDQRAWRLAEAQSALPDVDLPDLDHIPDIAELLEAKHNEMLDVILGCSHATSAKIRLPPSLIPNRAWDQLRNPICRDERLWLFMGGIQEILDQYRDQGRSLVLKERDRLLKRLSSGIRTTIDSIRQLDGYPVVALALNQEDRQQVASMLVALQASQALYQRVLTSNEEQGIQALLEDNYYQLQNQYTSACAQLCLQLYGNVSDIHLRELLSLKSMHLLSPSASEIALTAMTEAERKHLSRSRRRILKRVGARAAREAWPTYPILQLYHYNERFGRARPHEREQRLSEGVESIPTPTHRTGAPLIGGW